MQELRNSMTVKQNLPITDSKTRRICFGFDRATDESSLIAFIEAFAGNHLVTTLVSRLQDEEITEMVDYLTGLMKRHLTEKEYHQLFLSDAAS
jgi:hypothetical protein